MTAGARCSAWTSVLPRLRRFGRRSCPSSSAAACAVSNSSSATPMPASRGLFARVVNTGWQHLPRPLHAQHTLAHVGESRPRVVAAFIATAFAQDDAETTTAQWCKSPTSSAPKLPKLARTSASGTSARGPTRPKSTERPSARTGPLRDTTVSVFLRVAKHSCRMIVGR